jgi:two-component system sensor histidine kinase BarA
MTLQVETLDSLLLGQGARLEELIDREALVEFVKSFSELYSVGIRVFEAQGKLLAEATQDGVLFEYLRTTRGGRAALDATATAVKAVDPGPSGEAEVSCETGARYAVFGIESDGRRVGRIVLGPFFEPELEKLPTELLGPDSDIDPAEAALAIAALPRITRTDALRFGRHLVKSLDLILFSGYRALLTSNMHLLSVRESFRELEEKNRELQVAYDRLKELDRLKSNFLATVSHELRTPLTSIIGYSEMLAEGLAGELSDEQREFVQTIREKGEQLLQLIKGLLDLSKLESGTMSLRKQPMELSKLVRDVEQTMTPSAHKKGIFLNTSVDEALPLLHADEERLRQVLLNLVENALKFTPSGGSVSITATLTTMESNGGGADGGLVLLGARRPAVELRVADTGIGIPEAERERVFDAFYQVDSSSTREQGGTGLGLSIVKRLVDGHDGQVRIEDNVPRGTVFVITLPLKKISLSG